MRFYRGSFHSRMTTLKTNMFKHKINCQSINNQNKIYKTFGFFSIFEILSLIFNFTTFAGLPASSHFQLQNYSFGAGGTASSSSTHYSLNGVAGEVEFGRPGSTNYKAGSGLT